MFRKKASRFLSAILVSVLVASSLGGYTSKAEDSTETGKSGEFFKRSDRNACTGGKCGTFPGKW